MASAFAHAFVAVALGKMCVRQKMPRRFWGLAVASSLLPDADVITFGTGIQYEDVLGHRGFSHSLLFAALWSLLVVAVEFKSHVRFSRPWWLLVAFFFGVTASHGVLDALTNGGLGVAFFSPFDTARYFFPWTPVAVSPLTAGQFLSEWGVRVLGSELKYIVLPVALLWLTVWGVRKRAIG
jgi:inner membrane protein